MKYGRDRVFPYSLLAIFILAVLVPSVALGFLALRAAERESMYVERRLEGTLLAEVDLAAQRIEELMSAVFAGLQRDVEADATAARLAANPLIDVVFRLEGDNLDVSGSSDEERELFTATFGGFLLGDGRLPVYDSVARVYRKEMQHFAGGESSYGYDEKLKSAPTGSFRESPLPAKGDSSPGSASQAQAAPSAPAPEGVMMPPLPPAQDILSEAADYEEDAVADSNSPPAAAPLFTASPWEALQEPEELPLAQEESARMQEMEKKREAALPQIAAKLPAKGVERQIAESRIATDPAIREEAFQQATEQGFEIAQRNVQPQAQNILPNVPATGKDAGKDLPLAELPDERSKTVSRSRSFAELLDESDGGLLPRTTDRGLEILFWTKPPDGGATVGGTLRMDALSERILDVIPNVLSEVRILTVLDDRGDPILAPETKVVPDWRRPFVAREISPLLPRWEVGAWLTDPAILTSRARFAQLTIWVLVAVLFLAIAVGGAVVLRTLSMEMRIAGQKTTFVANVSHELKTPLTSIRLFAELLLSGKQPDEERRREYLRTMMSEADRLSHLVDNVLTFSKRGRENSPMQPLCLAELVQDTVSQLQPHLAKQGFKVTVEDEGPMRVLGNRESLRQVIMNILANAEKYSGDAREIDVSCAVRNGYAIVSVADRGIGVEPRFAEKIFQEFFRADDSLSALRSGAGLGLSIARDIARRHGGDILYTPRRDGGSVFSLRLPLQT